MEMARNAATRSTCNRAHVGAIIVRNNDVLATGFNGSVKGMAHCDDVGHLFSGDHCVRTIHAEINAIIRCALYGTTPNGATVYVTHYPCYECAKVLLNAGVTRIVYQNDYRKSHDLFEMAGIAVECVQ